jgi:DNA recombination protein RmuC
MQLAFLVLGIAVGAAIGWLLAHSLSLRQRQRQREESQAAQAALQSQAQAEREQRIAIETRLQEFEKRLEEQRSLVEEAKAQLGDTFKALSSDALRDNSQAFVESAKQTLEPVKEALRRYEDQIRALETTHQQVYGSLDQQLKSLLASESQLQRETSNLVSALRQPQVRGRWGELTLRRAVELAGMVEHVDYLEQPSAEGESGRLRPDMIVHLPADRQVVVDAKVSLDAYLSAVEADSEEARKACLTRHCRQIRDHMRGLAAKSYWEQFQPTPEFVVMYVPGESFLHAACDADHTLMEEGLESGVVLASPTTLIALLRAVAYGWRQEQVAQSAQQVSDLGRELYERIRVFLGHLSTVGRSIERAASCYNQAVGSLESRVLPSARRFRELGAASGAELPELEVIDTQPRRLTPPEAAEG